MASNSGTTWVESAKEHLDFSIYNIPFGLCSTKDNDTTRPVTRIGDIVVDLSILAKSGMLGSLGADATDALSANTLAALATLTAPTRRKVRISIQDVLSGSKPDNFPEEALFRLEDVQMHVPMAIGDYTDYCISVEHMKNAGRAVTGDPSIPKQMSTMPIGYHGRASSVITSGTPFRRPLGFYRPSPSEAPVLAASKKLDYEVELAFYVARKTELGQVLSIEEANDSILGVVIMNDWSARDIQSFEMTPLGPFQGKNFATTVSPWVVTLEALAPFSAPLPDRIAPEFARLNHPSNTALDIHLEVLLETSAGEKQVLADKIRATDFYWSLAQLLVHQTLSGCPVNIGDLIATGTCSGETEDSLGSIIEKTLGGSKPWHLPSGAARTFIEDGDTVTMIGRCARGDIRVGFGECSGLILPAIKP